MTGPAQFLMVIALEVPRQRFGGTTTPANVPINKLKHLFAGGCLQDFVPSFTIKI